MRYITTRSATNFYTFEDAVLGGYAPDGGLYVPETMPQVTSDILQEWAKLSFTDLATTLLCMFIDEIPREEIQEICKQSFTGFDDPTTVPVVGLSKSLFVAELFHGPTYCFKDLGLRILIHFMAYFAKKRNQKIVLLVSTTGDTGPAAVQAVQDANCDLLSILVHYPKGQISDFQRKQLTTVNSPRVKIVEFEGGGDDMDIPIKAITSDKSIAASKERLICGINSFNIGRPLAQMTHFVWTYLRINEELGIIPGDPNFTLDIVIPTGAMGNMVGGYMSKKMGIPFGKFTAGVNINDVSNTVITTGLIQKTTEPMKSTLSEAINIQLPYNLERLLYYLTNQNHDQIRDWYTTLEQTGNVKLGSKWLESLQEQFQSARVTDEELCCTVQAVLQKYGYWADPHTGVGFAAVEKLGYNDKTNPDLAVAVMATASPCKFQYAMTRALGEECWLEYEKVAFPKGGKALMEKKEIPPISFPSTFATLQENKANWQLMARNLITSL